MFFFFFNDTATTEIYTLSLHDALPILFPPLSERFHPLFRRRLSGDHLLDRKSTRLNSSHLRISYAVFCLKKTKRLVFVVQLTVRARRLGACTQAENLRQRLGPSNWLIYLKPRSPPVIHTLALRAALRR